ncbi:hypothetical protein [Bacillus mycoides]|nr:hypothetical protein [Bacillus mycoides]QWJ01502.1 hypothetical protein J5V93_03930 [Bacillus mycoides]
MGREVMSKVKNAALSGDTLVFTEQLGAEVEGAAFQDLFINDILSR